MVCRRLWQQSSSRQEAQRARVSDERCQAPRARPAVVARQCACRCTSLRLSPWCCLQPSLAPLPRRYALHTCCGALRRNGSSVRARSQAARSPFGRPLKPDQRNNSMHTNQERRQQTSTWGKSELVVCVDRRGASIGMAARSAKKIPLCQYPTVGSNSPRTFSSRWSWTKSQIGKAAICGVCFFHF